MRYGILQRSEVSASDPDRSVVRTRRRARRQRGHLMAGLMAALTIMLIFTTIVFQDWQDVLRRDLEAEMIFRAHEIARAIHRYRKDHGGQGPPSLEQLGKPGPRGQYYVRRLYEDPLVKDGKWGLLYMGPGGTIVDPAAVEAETLGGEVLGLKNVESLADKVDVRRVEGQREEAPVGLPIAGVKSLATEHPFRVYKGLTEYSQWLFTYLDLEVPAAGQGGQGRQPGQPGQRGFGGQQGRPGQGGLSGRGPNNRPGSQRQPPRKP